MLSKQEQRQELAIALAAECARTPRSSRLPALDAVHRMAFSIHNPKTFHPASCDATAVMMHDRVYCKNELMREIRK